MCTILSLLQSPIKAITLTTCLQFGMSIHNQSITDWLGNRYNIKIKIWNNVFLTLLKLGLLLCTIVQTLES